MPIHLAPILALGLVRCGMELMKSRKQQAASNVPATCGICHGRITGDHRITTCCGKPLCSDRCVRGYVAASIDGCLFHA